MASRLKLARAGAAVAGVSVALMMTAAVPAGAEPVTGKVDPTGYTNGHHVNVGKDYADMRASLIGFKLADGTSLQMYCVEIDTRINSKHGMVEQPWGSYPNADSPFHANRNEINWVLHNGFPVVDVEALTRTLTGQGAKLTNGISAKEAISATQAAVWHYSDGTALDEANPLPKGPRDAKADVVALYKYLTGPANTGIGEQPTPTLAISPAELAGAPGERVGPFTVTTTGDVEKVTADVPDGVKVVDTNGAEVTPEGIENGARLFLDVPAGTANGAGTFELTGSARVDTGRLFVSENYATKKTQSVIVATSEVTETTAAATAKWTEKVTTTTTSTTSTTTQPTPTTETSTTSPAPTTSSTTPAPQPKATSGGLATTGASILAPIVIGVVLVGAGIGALLFLRHRKRG